MYTKSASTAAPLGQPTNLNPLGTSPGHGTLVENGVDGTPCIVNRQQVAFVREEWRVVDRWWTEEPIDRRYYEVVLESGQNVCVYRDRDRERGCWFTQRG
jgi:hypothetical protein